ncbi:Purine catabolism regulatory protein-like family protein [Saccharopolyspora shandongensis]|uniref:Purine catabolism regulatory protein-like family protein n=1 Tax=Saccharopolyspora shandongensis TaxID=418495 RepID=A0A1H3RZV5_9PSEU|nr:helix-turn-helix domain-containing protein [Saccharopolyspora shandongensis]SDZ31212.1 Purine catabolism regulatory protein-like family protein [Saccharopolyspora shandongensis]
MRLRELVHEFDLGLSVVEAGASGLTGEVRRAYVTDLPDPSRFLVPGDLVLTSCLWYHEPADSRPFAAALARSRAAGLVVGLLVTRAMPAGLVAACAELGLPLLVIAEDRSFTPVCEIVLAEKQRLSLQQRQIADLVGVLGSDTAAPGEVSAHLRMLGADPHLPTVVVAASAGPGDGLAETLADLLAAPGRRLLVHADDDKAVLLVNGAAEHLDGVAAELSTAELPGRGRLMAGVSEPTASVSDLGSALEIARRRLRSARGHGPGRAPVVVSGSKVDSHAVLLSALPTRLRRSFRHHMLTPLADYDAVHGSDLIGTLTSFLESCGSWQRSAEELHVHVNTLRYRVQRIEQLTGRSLSSMRDRVDLYLALTCLDVAENNQPATGTA